jgi:uncharacterized protein with PQ loop repeat
MATEVAFVIYTIFWKIPTRIDKLPSVARLTCLCRCIVLPQTTSTKQVQFHHWKKSGLGIFSFALFGILIIEICLEMSDILFFTKVRAYITALPFE